MGSNPSLPACALFGKILRLSASTNLCKIIFILNKLFALLVTLKQNKLKGMGRRIIISGIITLDF